MLELFSVTSPAGGNTCAPALRDALAYSGPERRGGAALLTRLMTLMLDEVDYGLLLLDERRRVLHANHAARASLAAEGSPIQLRGRELQPRSAKDGLPLHQALQAASARGLRKLLTLGDGPERIGVAIVPLGHGVGGLATTLVVLGRRKVCAGLSVHGFAREHRLSHSEEEVLALLCGGCSPNDIADQHGVKIATVRTQIANIRAKTGAESIRDLVQQVAMLPPMVSALRQHVGPSAWEVREVA